MYICNVIHQILSLQTFDLFYSNNKVCVAVSGIAYTSTAMPTGRKMQQQACQKKRRRKNHGSHLQTLPMAPRRLHTHSSLALRRAYYGPDCANYPDTLPPGFGSGDFHHGLPGVIASAGCYLL